MTLQEALGDITPYEAGRLAALLGRHASTNPFPELDDGVSDWAVWCDGYIHADNVLKERNMTL